MLQHFAERLYNKGDLERESGLKPMEYIMTYQINPTDGRKSFYGKAIVEDENGVKRLYSYNTLVCEIADGNVTLKPMWNCSVTTLRHVRAFLRINGFEADSKADIAKRYGR